MSHPPANAYDLYLDESGTFQETSTVAAEQAAARARGRQFPSQLAGLLVSRGTLTEDAARDALQAAYRAAGLNWTGEVHGKNLPAGPAFDRLVTELVAE